jgi:hypothetical protein
MNTNIEKDLLLRTYLLGSLSPEEQQRIEQHLMIDSTAFEDLRWIEDELIDDYLEGALSGREKEKFENFFLSAPERRQKLDFAKALKRYVAGHRVKQNPMSSWESFWQTLLPPHHAVLRWSLVASLMLLVAGGSWSVVRISRLQKALEQAGTGESQKQLMETEARNSELALSLQREQARLKLLEQEAADLRKEDKRGLSSLLRGQRQPTLIAVTLDPGLLRDFGGSKRILIPAGTNLAQFDLKMEPLDYPQYQAILRRVDEGKIWTQISPKAESGVQSASFRLIVPVSILGPGDYVLKLSGITAVGDSEDIGSYYFRIIPN